MVYLHERFNSVLLFLIFLIKITGQSKLQALGSMFFSFLQECVFSAKAWKQNKKAFL